MISSRVLPLLVLLSHVFIGLVMGQQDQQSSPVSTGQQERIADEFDPLDEAVLAKLSVDLTQAKQKAEEEYNSGNYLGAARAYIMLLQHDIENQGYLYNLACCYGLLGKSKLAATFLNKAYDGGFNQLEHIRRDPDFNPVRESDDFKAVMLAIESKEKARLEGAGQLNYYRSPSFIPYRIQLPENYESTKSYPLLVGLHGFGGNPDEFSKVWGLLAKHEFIFVTPQAPYPFSLGTAVGYSWNLVNSADESTELSSDLCSQRYIVDLIQTLKNQYKISDVFLFGFSQGASLALRTGIANHKLFKGLIIFGGWLDSEALSTKELNRGNELRIFIAHGTADRIIESAAATEMNAKLTDLGYPVVFKSFDDGHTIPKPVFQEAIAWMHDQSK